MHEIYLVLGLLVVIVVMLIMDHCGQFEQSRYLSYEKDMDSEGDTTKEDFNVFVNNGYGRGYGRYGGPYGYGYGYGYPYYNYRSWYPYGYDYYDYYAPYTPWYSWFTPSYWWW